MKICQHDNCNEECLYGRRYCNKHYLEYRKNLYYKHKNKGDKYRTTYHKTCIVCGKEYEGFSKDSLYCSQKCYRKSSKILSNGYNSYVYDVMNYKNSIHVHRNIAIKILGRKLNTNEVVHHLDLNTKNNDITNLIILSRFKHSSLHNYLMKQRALLEQSNNENIENCWKTLIVPMTTTWLETANVKVIKLWEIGQSAAEPLLNEEGSETMHDTSLMDDDIVQTTTNNSD